MESNKEKQRKSNDPTDSRSVGGVYTFTYNTVKIALKIKILKTSDRAHFHPMPP